MGFAIGGNTAVLEFGDWPRDASDDMPWVRCSLDVPIERFMEIQQLSVRVAETSAAGAKEAASELRALIELFGNEAVLDWNLEDREHHPLPVGAEGLLKLPMRYLLDVIGGWVSAATGTPPESEAASEPIEPEAAVSPV